MQTIKGFSWAWQAGCSLLLLTILGPILVGFLLYVGLLYLDYKLKGGY